MSVAVLTLPAVFSLCFKLSPRLVPVLFVASLRFAFALPDLIGAFTDGLFVVVQCRHTGSFLERINGKELLRFPRRVFDGLVDNPTANLPLASAQKNKKNLS